MKQLDERTFEFTTKSFFLNLTLLWDEKEEKQLEEKRKVLFAKSHFETPPEQKVTHVEEDAFQWLINSNLDFEIYRSRACNKKSETEEHTTQKAIGIPVDIVRFKRVADAVYFKMLWWRWLGC